MSEVGMFRQPRVRAIISSMELPEDVTEWVNAHFSNGEEARALTVLRTATIHTGDPATLDYSDVLSSVLKAFFGGLKGALNS